ncbi:Pyrimidine ABC transporter, ATP-binding protein [Nitrincola lacisaponensis]|uniref:Pyrimidine ABC transporter, ATP-binding protein n=1 Tax=Nitrincola lacisaponensis TaxID=267850 RepID=A0A063Y0Z3_9GAMM|nr:ABC transporter ATP-binding protein [Nitrincola lacisaponensis]KDE38436.1 Pyrimidine ABC transporter, ATP-binding protein [Nitrincola lacisaponensis]
MHAVKLQPETSSPTKPHRLMIGIDDLSLVFETNDGPVHALSHINLDIHQGDFVSFIGPSGCGKTTLLRVIADLEQQTSGTIHVGGTSPQDARLNRLYGYVFQAPALFPWRTIASNCALPMEISAQPKSHRQAQIDKYLTMVGLQDFKHKFPWQLSGGMQQRASIARALCLEPELLLMDEPFGALDEITRDHLNMELLKIWKATGKTLVFVTHSIPEAVLLSTHIVVMSPRPGRIIKVIESPLPRDKTLALRDSEAFHALAAEIRQALASDHQID